MLNEKNKEEIVREVLSPFKDIKDTNENEKRAIEIVLVEDQDMIWKLSELISFEIKHRTAPYIEVMHFDPAFMPALSLLDALSKFKRLIVIVPSTYQCTMEIIEHKLFEGMYTCYMLIIPKDKTDVFKVKKEELENITNELKTLANASDTPVITCTHQLNEATIDFPDHIQFEIRHISVGSYNFTNMMNACGLIEKEYELEKLEIIGVENNDGDTARLKNPKTVFLNDLNVHYVPINEDIIVFKDGMLHTIDISDEIVIRKDSPDLDLYSIISKVSHINPLTGACIVDDVPNWKAPSFAITAVDLIMHVKRKK